MPQHPIPIVKAPTLHFAQAALAQMEAMHEQAVDRECQSAKPLMYRGI